MNQKSAWIVPNLQPTGKFVPKLKKKKKCQHENFGNLPALNR